MGERDWNGQSLLSQRELILDKDPADDPDWKTKPKILPGRGFQPIGYAAVSTAGLARSGELKEDASGGGHTPASGGLIGGREKDGLPREQIFTHCGGWAEGEKLYQSALNADSCPGWSFYRYARSAQRQDRNGGRCKIQCALLGRREWRPIGARTADDYWRQAIENTLSIDRCRYVCLYNSAANEDRQGTARRHPECTVC